MSIVGEWKFDAGMSYETNEYITAEEYINELPSYINKNNAEEVEHEKAERKMTTESILNVTADGKMEFLMPISPEYTQEEIDAAVAEGEIEVRGKMMLVEVIQWKEENGTNFFSNGTVSVGDDASETCWEELECEDDKIILNGMRYARA